ncbi:hypothetical protein HYQ45_018842 [Verticillium longisporum]|uniref:Uncharacterized protein n=1 Tax=Verticillium longisporum TaxID=100787 RepID=A0A8I2ZVQ2_VERLO|nr:hypothetical protein HYQ45_018842 [Verticillium longisporum]
MLDLSLLVQGAAYLAGIWSAFIFLVQCIDYTTVKKLNDIPSLVHILWAFASIVCALVLTLRRHILFGGRIKKASRILQIAACRS